LDRARSGGAGVAPRPVLPTHALPEHPAGRHPRSRVRPPRRRARARTRPRRDRGREASPAVTWRARPTIRSAGGPAWTPWTV